MVVKALVVDDSKIVRDMHSFFLETGGFEVESAENGSEAIEKLLMRRFDVIVTDINMPQMDGYEFTRRVRQTRGYEKTPVIMVSTEAEAKDKTLGFEAGANVYVVKPTTAEELVAHAKFLVEAGSE